MSRYRVRMDFFFDDGDGNGIRIPHDNMRCYDDGRYDRLLASIRRKDCRTRGWVEM